MAYDSDSELRIAITTDAELAALKQSKAELQGLLRTTEKNSEAAKGYARILEDVDKALDSSNAKLIERTQHLQKLIELGEKTGADVSNETAELKQLGEQAKQSGISISDFSNASDVAGAVVRQSTGQVKAFGLGFRQLNRSMSAFTKYVPGLSIALRFVSGGALASMAAIMLLGTALDKLMQHFKKAKEEAEKFFEEMGKPAVNAYKAAQEAADENAKSVRENAARIRELEDGYKTLAERMALYTEQAKLETQHRRADQTAVHERELKDLEALHEAKLITEDEYYRRSQALAAKAEEDKRQAERDAEQQELEQKRAATQVLLAMNKEQSTEREKIQKPLEAERQWQRLHGDEVAIARKDAVMLPFKVAGLERAEAEELANFNTSLKYYEALSPEAKKYAISPAALGGGEKYQEAKKAREDKEADLRAAKRTVEIGRGRAENLADLEAEDKKIQKRIDDTEDETKKLEREAAQLEALIQVRERYRQQSAQMSAQKQQEAAADRALAAEPGLLGGVREAYALGASGRATGSQRTALAALGISGPGTEAGYLATARRLAVQRQGIIRRLAAGGLKIPEQRKLESDLATLNAQLGSVTGGGEWERSQAPRYATGGLIQATGPAVVHGGEAVLNPGAVQALGAGNVGALNAGARLKGWAAKKLRDLFTIPMPNRATGGAIPVATEAAIDMTPSALTEAGWQKTLGVSGEITEAAAKGKPFKIEHVIEAIRKGRKVVITTAEGEVVHGLENLKGASNSAIRRVLEGLGMPANEAEIAKMKLGSTKPISPSDFLKTGPSSISGTVSATARGVGSNWRLAAMLAGSRFAAAAPRVAARLAAGEITHAELNYLAGQVNTEAVTNQSGTTLADEGTGLGAVTGVGIDALAGGVAAGPGGAIIAAALGLATNTGLGLYGWGSEVKRGRETTHLVGIAQMLRAKEAASVMPAGYSPVIHRRPDVAQKLGAARSGATRSAAEAALARANAAVAGSYSFGAPTTGEQLDRMAREREAQVRAAAIARSEDAARARAANDRRADELRLRDARAGNFTGLIGHQALAFHMEQASIVAQSVSTLQADMESRLKNARGAF